VLSKRGNHSFHFTQTLSLIAFVSVASKAIRGSQRGATILSILHRRFLFLPLFLLPVRLLGAVKEGQSFFLFYTDACSSCLSLCCHAASPLAAHWEWQSLILLYRHFLFLPKFLLPARPLGALKEGESFFLFYTDAFSYCLCFCCQKGH